MKDTILLKVALWILGFAIMYNPTHAQVKNTIYDITVTTPCRMTLVYQNATRKSYGCKSDTQNMRIGIDPAEPGLTIRQMDKAYEYAKLRHDISMKNKQIIPFNRMEATQYDQQENNVTIRHLNFIYKNHVYNVMFAMPTTAIDYNKRYQTFINSIALN